MYTCAICHYEVAQDDVEIGLRGGRCVCTRCYHRETGTARPLPVLLQLALEDALATG